MANEHSVGINKLPRIYRLHTKFCQYWLCAWLFITADVIVYLAKTDIDYISADSRAVM